MGTLATAPRDFYKAFSPLAPQLFEVSLMEYTPSPAAFPPPDTKLYCSAYDIPTPSIETWRSEFLKANFVVNYKTPIEVTITWMEDDNLSVWNYHQRWLQRFYNREKDQYATGAAGKKRRAIITLQKFTTDLSGDLENTHTITLKGLVPASLPPLKGSWEDDASRSSGISLKYFVDGIIYSGEDNDRKEIWV